jgi:DNA-binding transcriptional regulator GbsR (MarR family)
VAESGQLPEVGELADQVGEFIYYWGFKRVHGRIWTHLFLARQALDAADLVRQMRISKALISISLRELMDYDVVQLAGRSARGTQLYRSNPDILAVILNVLRQRETRLLARVVSAQEELARADDDLLDKFNLDRARVADLGEFTRRAAGALEALISLRSVDFGEWRCSFMATSDAPIAPDDAKDEGPPSASENDHLRAAHDERNRDRVGHSDAQQNSRQNRHALPLEESLQNRNLTQPSAPSRQNDVCLPAGRQLVSPNPDAPASLLQSFTPNRV